MKSGLSKKEINILFIGIILVAFFVFLPTWASYRATKLSGPRLIAEDSENRIWIDDNAAIYILDSDGNILCTHPIESLNITPPLASFCPMPDGGMLVGSRETGLIHHVRYDGTRAGFINLSETGAGRPFGAFHLLYDSEQDEIYLSDTSNHRIIVINRSGDLLRSQGLKGTPGFFHFPNAMVKDKRGKILVADTNNHAIKVLSKDLELEDSLMPMPVLEKHFVWPALLSIDNRGRLYVVNYSSDLKYGALVRLDERGIVETTFPLQEGIMPISMLVRDKDVLLTDKKDFTIWRIDSENEEASPFGSEALHGIFEASHKEVELYHIVKTASRYLLIIFLVVLLILLAIERKRRAAAEKAAATMDTGLPGPPVSSFSVWMPIGASVGVMLLALLLLVMASRLLSRSPAYVLILGVTLLLLLGCLAFIIYWTKSRFFIQYTNHKIFKKHASTIRKCLPSDEPIRLLGMCQIKYKPIFLVATDNRFLLFSMSLNFTAIMAIQEVSFRSINRASLSRRTIANRTGLTRARFVFSLYGLPKDFVLNFQDYHTAQQLLDMVETTREARATSEPVIRSRCKTCCSVLDVQGRCPSCGIKEQSMWKPIILSIFLPGLGQIYNGELSEGCLFLIIYGLSILYLIKPVAALVHRLAAVDMPDLVEHIVITFFIWLISLIDTIHIAYKNRHHRWGLKL